MNIKSILVASAVMVIGFAGTAFAGMAAPWPGYIGCSQDGEEYEMCHNGLKWEIDYKCEGYWVDDGTHVDINDYEEAQLRATGGANGYADCRIDIDLESDDDVHKYEVKCEAPESTTEDRGNSGKTKEVHDKVELKIKATYDEYCHYMSPN